ncbi:TetR/AcrR family transcriptional regulator [Roseibium sediminicola]|uniref:TetR/AcrR family transcriptional regulator n=1 Tax=Roseibium sediminicola TaxID=2933272 RepID=A0ABT0H388_9HYPH|nr:TetR/AcrR family transcriptional regulator [Roseibium sp. CAU 1639]MCK7616139.1 TetR/AcrR family transcriptional regulator [Roseibium sp. CAU 1639]
MTRRRTQDERSAETRRLLHQATIASLLEVGYANTSTPGIVQRAGVSRGAQTHHYPGKIDLIVAATEAMFDGFAEDIEKLAAGLRQSNYDLDTFLEKLWAEMLNGTWFYASLEIIVAARGDQELRKRLEPLILDLHARFEAVWEATFTASDPKSISSRTAMNLVMNVFRGMAVQAVLRKDKLYFTEMIQAIKSMLRSYVTPVAEVTA